MSKQDGMDLRDFVSSVLLDVVSGVHDAAHKVREEHSYGLRAAINPKSGGRTSNVEFEVAIAASQSGQVGLGVKVPFLEMGGASEVAKERTSRIRFSVPVAFASQPVGSDYTTAPSPPPLPDPDPSSVRSIRTLGYDTFPQVDKDGDQLVSDRSAAAIGSA